MRKLKEIIKITIFELRIIEPSLSIIQRTKIRFKVPKLYELIIVGSAAPKVDPLISSPSP